MIQTCGYLSFRHIIAIEFNIVNYSIERFEFSFGRLHYALFIATRAHIAKYGVAVFNTACREYQSE